MKKLSKIFAVVLCLALALSMLTMGASAAETVTCTKITSLEQLVDGQYVIIGTKDSDNYAMGSWDGSWITVTTPTISGTSATVDTNAVWTIDYDKDAGTLTLKDSLGNFVQPKGGNNNGMKAGTYNWDVTCADGVFTIAGAGSDTVRLAFNLNESGKSRAYKMGTLDGQNGSQYIDELTLYKTNSAVQDTREDLPTSASAIVDAIYALESGESLSKYYKFDSFTMSGTIVEATEVWNEQFSNGTVTIKVEGTDKELIAFRYKAGEMDVEDIQALVVGDKVTFTVTSAKNYEGDLELDQPTLTAIEKAAVNPNPSSSASSSNATTGTENPDPTGDNTAIVSMTAVMVLAVTALAALVIGNKKRKF